MTLAISPVSNIEFYDLASLQAIPFMPPELYERSKGGDPYPEGSYERYLNVLGFPSETPGVIDLVVTQPLATFDYQGQKYFLNGQSRLTTLYRAANDTRCAFNICPVPVLHYGELTLDQVTRAQIDFNDATRPHDAYGKMISFVSRYQAAISEGVSAPEAKKRLSAIYEITAATVSNYLAIADNLDSFPDTLKLALEAGSVAPDTVKLLIQASGATSVPVSDILDQLKPRIGDDFKVTATMVKAWRAAFDSTQDAPTEGEKAEGETSDGKDKPPFDLVAAETANLQLISQLNTLGELEIPDTADQFVKQLIGDSLGPILAICAKLVSGESASTEYLPLFSEIVSKLLMDPTVQDELALDTSVYAKLTKRVNAGLATANPLVLGITNPPQAEVE